MKFLLLVIDLICIHIYLDLISLHLTYINSLRLSFLMQAWAFIKQFCNERAAVNFRTAKVWERVLSKRCVYIDFAHGLFSIGALDMPKMSQGTENGLWTTPIFILEKLKDFDCNGVGRGNH